MEATPVSFPEKISVLGQTFNVVKSSDIISGSNVCEGRVSVSDSLIEIDSEISQQRAWIVLLHEIIHAVEADLLGEREFEEYQINLLAYAFYSFLACNNLPRLFYGIEDFPHINKRREKNK